MYINCSAKLFSVEGDIKYYNILHIHIKYYIKKICVWNSATIYDLEIHSKEQTSKRLSHEILKTLGRFIGSK